MQIIPMMCVVLFSPDDYIRPSEVSGMNHAKQGFNVTIEIGHDSRWHRIRPGNVHRAVSCFQKACAMHLARACRLPFLLAQRQILALYECSLVLALLLETGSRDRRRTEERRVGEGGGR